MHFHLNCTKKKQIWCKFISNKYSTSTKMLDQLILKIFACFYLQNTNKSLSILSVVIEDNPQMIAGFYHWYNYKPSFSH